MCLIDEITDGLPWDKYKNDNDTIFIVSAK